MKKVNLIFAIVLVVVLTLNLELGTLNCSAQNIGINTTGATPYPSSILDVSSANKGMLIPRVALVNAATGNYSSDAVIPNPNNKLIVFNTNVSVTGGNGVGIYYYDSTNATTGKWVYVVAPSNGSGTTGQVLASQGSGSAPKWLSLSGGLREGSALGTAMTTAIMDSIGLFTPHTNSKCNASTEVFISLYGTGATAVGYCIEKAERATANWTTAKLTCLAVGKRLPEPEEWQVACDSSVASPTKYPLATMGSAWEWASNFALPMYVGSGSGMGAAIFGSSGCGYADWGWLGSSTGSRGTFAFRCVH